MLKTATCAMTCVVLALLLPDGGAVASERNSAPSSGTYQGEVFVNSVTGSGCLDKAGYAFIASMSFPGLSGTTWYLRALETGGNFAVESQQTLTVRSGKGSLSPGGSMLWDGSGIGDSWSESGTFTSSVTEIGTHAFVLALTEKYGSCTEVLNIPLARIGVDQ